MLKLPFILVISLVLISCAKTDEEEVRSVIAEAKYHLSSMDCSDAIDVLDEVSFQEDNADYISVYASAQACSAGYKELDFFQDELTNLDSSNFIGSLAAFSSSLDETTADSTAYVAMDNAIKTLLGYDNSSGTPSTSNRNSKFGTNESGDMSLQALYMLFYQMGKHFALYGNAGSDGAKGGDANSFGNDCIYSYTTQDAVDWITANGASLGTCNTANGTNGSDFLENPETSADIKTRLCNGIIYYNNMMDILGNVTLPASDSLGDVSNIQTALNTLMTAAELAETGAINDGDANGQDAIANLKDITRQSDCEDENIERIEKFYAIFFETIYQ